MPQYEDLKLDILRAIYEDAFRPGSLSGFSATDLERVYSISREGIKYVKFVFEDLSIDNNETRNFVARDSKVEIPASDRVVSLNHNGDPYVQAIKSLNEALTAFEQDHRLENEWGIEKGVLIQSIEGGQNLLRESQVRVRSIVITTVEPLKIIAERYCDAIAAGMITTGLDQVLPSVEKEIASLLRLLGLS